jgi:hypothetical protein
MHEEVQLHPAVTIRRYRNRRGLPTVPCSQPDDHEVALRRRRCEADLYGDPFDHIAKRLRPTATKERNCALRAVVDGDENGIPPSSDTTNVVPSGPAEVSPQRPLVGPFSTPLTGANGRVTNRVCAPQPLPTATTSATATTMTRFIFCAIGTVTSFARRHEEYVFAVRALAASAGAAFGNECPPKAQPFAGGQESRTLTRCGSDAKDDGLGEVSTIDLIPVATRSCNARKRSRLVDVRFDSKLGRRWETRPESHAARTVELAATDDDATEVPVCDEEHVLPAVPLAPAEGASRRRRKRDRHIVHWRAIRSVVCRVHRPYADGGAVRLLA